MSNNPVRINLYEMNGNGKNQPLPIIDELVHEKERYKSISEELDQTFQALTFLTHQVLSLNRQFQELSGY